MNTLSSSSCSATSTNSNSNNNNNNLSNVPNSPPLSPLLSPPLSPISASSSGIVEVVLLEGKNLASKNKSADVYVRMKVGDGFFHWSKTSTAKTTRPKWNFVCVLKVRPKQTKILHLRVNEVNFFSPDDTLGECRVNLEELRANESHEMNLPLFPTNSNNNSLSQMANKGELRFIVSYHPNGKSVLPCRDPKATLFPLLDNRLSISGPSTTQTTTTTTTTTTATTTTTTNCNSAQTTNSTSATLNKMITPFIVDASSTNSNSQPKSPEQIQAEQLYNKAMEDMSRFVEYARTAKKQKSEKIENLEKGAKFENFEKGEKSEKIEKISETGEIENTLAPAALRMASQHLFESLKLHRSGKSFAMLAFIFFQFDSLELTSKYLGYATQLEPQFPVISRLRKLLVESGCEREPLDEKSTNDRLSAVVVSAKNLPPNSPSVLCRLVVGYPEIPKDTPIATFEESMGPIGTVNWEIFFEVSLTKATERYHYGHQNLIIQVYEKRDEQVELLGESEPLSLFSVERDKVIDKWVNLKNNKGEVRVVFNYQMGFMTKEEMLPLLFTALLSKDDAMVTSLVKRNPNYNLPFRDTNSHATPSELEPKYSTLLTKAARYGNVRMIKELLELGASINAPDVDGFTPLMRAVQFDGVHENTRAIRFLLQKGADISIKNHRSFDVFAYCQTVDMRIFLKTRTQMQIYEFAVVICPSCKFVQFPSCSEKGKKTLQGKDCSCEVKECPNCSFQLVPENRKMWLSSLREIHYAGQAFSLSLPSLLDHYLFQCPACSSFGFPGTFTPTGSQLTSASDHSVIGTSDNSFERVEFSLKDAETMWTLLYHGDQCSLHTASYQLVKVILSRDQVMSLIDLSANSTSFFDSSCDVASDSLDSSFTIEQLPTEILQHIVGYLSCEDLAFIERCNKKMKETIDDSFYKSLVTRDFHIRFPHGEDSWKETYLFYNKTYKWVKELLFEENFFPRCTNTITEKGLIEVRLRLNGKKYLFNLDGTPFTFEEEFILVLFFSGPGVIVDLNIIAQGQSSTNALQLCSVLTLPSTNINGGKVILSSDLHSHQNGKVTLTLAMDPAAIKRWVAPYLSMNVPGFYAFLMLKDNVAGSVILDIFYYTLRSIVLEPLVIKNE